MPPETLGTAQGLNTTSLQPFFDGHDASGVHCDTGDSQSSCSLAANSSLCSTAEFEYRG
jgi:hypothetical protein